MKTKIFTSITLSSKWTSFLLTFAFCLLPFALSSQTPQGFNYQAVARDGDNNILANTALEVKIGLLQGNETETLVWEEIHSVTTNDLGLFTLKIGDTTAINSDGTVATFSDIDWALGSYYIKTEVDNSGSFIDLGSTELLSVPYALFAKDVEIKDDTDADPTNEIQDLQLSGNDLSITNNSSPTVIDLSTYLDNTNYWIKNGDTVYLTGNNVGIGTTSPAGRLQVIGETINDEEPLFEVKNKDGQTIFAVYNKGVRVYVDTAGTKGPKGGFAVGGFSSSKGSTEYLRVTPDSIRIYIDTSSVKGPKGGFAVGGYSSSKGVNQELLRVTLDSTRIYIPEETAKGSKGGFAVGGYSQGKSVTSEFFNVSGSSTTQTIDPSEPIVLWYPKKEAFLTGRVLIESPDSIGTNSFSTGYESKAIGNWSQAMGYKAIARGNYSTSIGNESIANNESSFSLGDSTFAGGISSTAIGYKTNATGLYSTAIGNRSTSAGALSFVFGQLCEANAVNSIAGGISSIANGENSLAFGSGAVTNEQNATAFGINTEASGFSSLAIGTNCTASGMYSTAMGYGAQAIGQASLAIGGNNVSNGIFSMSIGANCEANNSYSGAIGDGAIANGSHSMALGYQTESDGALSIAMGDRTYTGGIGSATLGLMTNTIGNYSMAIGDNTTAKSYASLVIGRYNVIEGNQLTWIDTDPLFVCGNGTSSLASSNAFTILKNGNVGISMPDPAVKLDISGGDARVEAGYHWLIDSDIRYKKNIVTLSRALYKVISIRGVRYDLKEEEDISPDKGKYIGFIAQELEKVFPELVVTDEKGYKSVAYNKMTAILVEAIKDQHKLIEDQQSEIDQLKELVNTIITKLDE